MLRFKLYRWVRVMFGARSFVKPGNNVLIKATKGNQDALSDRLLNHGWIEEWPVEREDDV